MVNRCVAMDCRNSNLNGHSVFSFPKGPIREEWIKFVQANRADFLHVGSGSRLCDAHFTPACFIRGSKIKSLIPGVIPTIHADSIQAPSTKKRRHSNSNMSNESEEMSENSEEHVMSTRKSARGVTPAASTSDSPAPKTPSTPTDQPSTFAMTTRAKTDPEAALRKRHSITSMFKATNITKADDGSLIYKRRESAEVAPKKKVARTVAASRMSGSTSTSPVRALSPPPTPGAADNDSSPGRKRKQMEADGTPSKKKRTARATADDDGEARGPLSKDGESDFYCWLCHKEGHVILCELCPRVFHIRCLGIDAEPQGEWVCPECEVVLRAECEETRSKAMSLVSVDQLCTLLRFALSRMKCTGSEPFQKPVDTTTVTEYMDYVFKPMCLSTIEKNIRKKEYGSTEAMLADTKWILHNCIVFNGASSKLTNIAKSIVKICTHEMSEIEICPDCYFNSCTKRNDNWFCEPCRSPHTLVWAKMKGYPFWPAKALREVNGQMDARFFGEHDRAWVPVNQVFLLSKEPPTSMKSGRKGFDESMQELALHIQKIRDRFGSFNYAPFRTPYDLSNPYLPSKVKTPDRSPASASSSTRPSPSPSPSRPPRRLFPHSPGRLPRGLEGEGGEGGEGEIKQEEDYEDAVPEGVEEDAQMGLDEEESKDEGEGEAKDDEDKDIEVKEVKDTEDNIKSKDVTTATNSKPVSKNPSNSTSDENSEKGKSTVDNSQTKPMPFQPSTSTAGKLTIVNKLAQKLSALESETETLETETESVKTETETKPETETATKDNSETVKKDPEEKTPLLKGASSGEAIAQDEILEEILSKAKEHEKKQEDEAEKEKLVVKPNPFLSKLVESCKEKLGISEDQLTESPTKDKEDEEEEEEEEIDEDDDDYEEEEESSESSEEESDDEDEKMEDDDESEPKKVEEGMEIDDKEKENVAKVTELEKVVPADEIAQVKENEKRENTEEPMDTQLTERGEKKTSTESAEEDTTAVKLDEKTAPQEGGSEKSVPESQPQSQKKDPEGQKSEPESQKKEPESQKMEPESQKSPSESQKTMPESQKNKPESQKNKPESLKNEPESHPKSQMTEPVSQQSQSEIQNSEPECQMIEPVSQKIEPKRQKSEQEQLAELAQALISERDWETAKRIGAEIARITCKQGKAAKTVPPPEAIGQRNEKNAEKADSLSLLKSTKMSDASPQEKRPPSATSVSVIELDKDTSPPEKRTPAPSVSTIEINEDTSPQEKRTPAPSVSTIEINEDTSPQEKRTPAPTVSTIEINEDASPQEKRPLTMAEKLQCQQARTQRFITLDIGDTQEKIEVKLGEFDMKAAASKVLNSLLGTMRDMCQDVLSEQANGLIHEALQEEVARIQWKHQQELNELRHNMNLTIHEMRSTLDQARETMMQKQEKVLKAQWEKAVEETKKKQWCANCGKEAIFYCCWNTSYCDYPCQQAHWTRHMHTCTQADHGDKAPPPPQQQQQPPKQPTVSSAAATVKSQPSGSNSEQPSAGGDGGWKDQARMEFEEVLGRHKQTAAANTTSPSSSVSSAAAATQFPTPSPLPPMPVPPIPEPPSMLSQKLFPAKFDRPGP